MTGILKKHRATYAAEGSRFWFDICGNASSRGATGVYRQGLRCPTIKDLTGSEWNYIYASRGPASSFYNDMGVRAAFNMTSFYYMTAVATNDKLEDWDITDWQVIPVGTSSQSIGCMFNENVMQQIFTINVINNSVDHYETNTDPIFVPNKFYEKDGNNYILLTELPPGDSYEPNDNPAFALDTFYELVSDEYVLLTSEPLNWSTNYMDYYIFVPGVEWSRDYGNYYILVEAEDIEVSCIRFKKNFSLCADNQYDANYTSPQYTSVACLAYSYYLDELVTISPGNSHTLTIKISPTEY